MAKLRHFCVVQERCESEVRDKLKNLGANTAEIEEAIEALKNTRFLDENRFVELYALSKLRQKYWGKNKIRQAMLLKHIDHTLVEKGIQSIDDEEYLQILDKLVEKKKQLLATDNPKLDPEASDDYAQKAKLINYLLAKGFEMELIWKAIG